MKPLVSVIVPMYNTADFVVEALESIMASTYRPIEIIVVDDGSTDNGLSVVHNYAETHREVRIFTQINAGVSAARNYAIRMAHGKYILPVDADDRISPTYIAHAVRVMNDNVRVVGCLAHFFGIRKGEWKLPKYSPELLAHKNMIHISSLFRKADWEIVGGFCEEEIYREDWDFWLNIMELGGSYIRLNEVGLYYRVQQNSRRRMAKNQKRLIVDAINRRHPAYMERYLGGPLHYHRSWSKLLNKFRSVKQVGEFTQWTEGEVIFSKRNTIRCINNVIVKQFATPSLWRGIIYGLVCKSKAQRSYEYACQLTNLTPTPIAYREVRICGVLRESWYACAKSECEHTFNELIGTPNFPNRNAILTNIGRFTAKLHKQGILHQDYSGGNILFNSEGTHIEIVDLNRIHIRKYLSRQQRLQNFERLNIDRQALQTIATAYAEDMNEDAQADAEYIITHRWYKHIRQNITNL